MKEKEETSSSSAGGTSTTTTISGSANTIQEDHDSVSSSSSVGDNPNNLSVTPRLRVLASDELASSGSSALQGSGTPPSSRPSTPTTSSRQHPMSERQQFALLMKQEHIDNESTAGSSTTPGGASPRPQTQGALSPMMSGGGTPDRVSGAGPGSSRSTSSASNVGSSQSSSGLPPGVDKKLFKRNDKGETQLHLAAKKGDLKLVKRLIKAGAEVNAQDNAGWTPLHESTIRNYVDVTKLLLRYGAAANLRGLHGETALHDAAANGHERILRCLLRHKADPTQCNDAGKTALDVARDANIAELLRSGGRPAQPISNPPSTGHPTADSTSGSLMVEDTKSCTSSTGSDRETLTSTPPMLVASGSGSTSDRHSPRLGLTIRLPSAGGVESTSAPGASLTPPTAPAISVSNVSPQEVTAETACSSSVSSTVTWAGIGASEVTPPVIMGPSTSEEPPPQPPSPPSSTTAEQPPPPAKFFHREEKTSSATASSKPSLLDPEDPYAFKDDSEPLEEDVEMKPLKRKEAEEAVVPPVTMPEAKCAPEPPVVEPATLGTNEALMKKEEIKTEPADDDADKGDGDADEPMRVPPLRIRIPQQEKVAADAAAAAVAGDEGEEKDEGNVEEGLKKEADVKKEAEEAEDTPSMSGVAPDMATEDKVSVCSEGSTAAQSGEKIEESLLPGGGSGSGSDSAAESTTGTGEGRKGRGGRTLRSHTAALRGPSTKDRKGGSQSDPVDEEEAADAANNGSEAEGETVSAPNATTQPSSSQTATEAVNSRNSPLLAVGQTNGASVAAPPKKRKLRSRPEVAAGQDVAVTSAVFDSNASSTAKQPKIEIPENPADKLQAVKKLLNQRIRRLVPVQPKAPKGYQDYLLVTCKYLLAGKQAQALLLQSERVPAPHGLHLQLAELYAKQEDERHRLRLAHRAERDKLCLAAEQEVVREHTHAALAMAGQARPFSFCAVIADRDFTHLPGDFVDMKDDTSGNSGGATSSSTATAGATSTGAGATTGPTAVEGSRCKQLSRHFITCLNDVVEKYEKLKTGLLCRHHHEADSLQAVQRLDWDLKMRELHPCDRREPRIGSRIPRESVPPVTVPDNFVILPQRPI